MGKGVKMKHLITITVVILLIAALPTAAGAVAIVTMTETLESVEVENNGGDEEIKSTLKTTLKARGIVKADLGKTKWKSGFFFATSPTPFYEWYPVIGRRVNDSTELDIYLGGGVMVGDENDDQRTDTGWRGTLFGSIVPLKNLFLFGKVETGAWDEWFYVWEATWTFKYGTAGAMMEKYTGLGPIYKTPSISLGESVNATPWIAPIIYDYNAEEGEKTGFPLKIYCGINFVFL